MLKEQFLINWFQWCYWRKWRINIDKHLQEPSICNKLSGRVFLGVVQGIFSWLPILLYCGYFSMSFHSYITSPSKRKSDDLLSYFKTYDFKKESIIGTPGFFFFLVLDVLVLLIFFSPHVYAKFNCFKTVAVDSILCCAGFRIRCKINWNTKIHCWQLLQLSIIMFKKALELVTFLKLLHVP